MKAILFIVALLLVFTGCDQAYAYGGKPYYRVGTDRYIDSTFAYTEKDQCVYYIDMNGRENKICGEYSVYGLNGAKLK